MKIILVKNCCDCPYGSQWSLDDTEYFCSKTNEINYGKDKIPEDCPLSDAVKVMRKFIEENK